MPNVFYVTICLVLVSHDFKTSSPHPSPPTLWLMAATLGLAPCGPGFAAIQEGDRLPAWPRSPLVSTNLSPGHMSKDGGRSPRGKPNSVNHRGFMDVPKGPPRHPQPPSAQTRQRVSRVTMVMTVYKHESPSVFRKPSLRTSLLAQFH